jgi:hypothetical protein
MRRDISFITPSTDFDIYDGNSRPMFAKRSLPKPSPHVRHIRRPAVLTGYHGRRIATTEWLDYAADIADVSGAAAIIFRYCRRAIRSLCYTTLITPFDTYNAAARRYFSAQPGIASLQNRFPALAFIFLSLISASKGLILSSAFLRRLHLFSITRWGKTSFLRLHEIF